MSNRNSYIKLRYLLEHFPIRREKEGHFLFHEDVQISVSPSHPPYTTFQCSASNQSFKRFANRIVLSIYAGTILE